MDTAASAGFAFQSVAQGYAIPINQALALAKQIVAGQASLIVHIGATPFLGVSVAPADSSQGAQARSSSASSPARPPAQAGLVAGDTITALDGQPIATYDQLSSLLLQHTAGDTVTL